MKIRILSDNPSIGIKADEVYYAERYSLDPMVKYTLLSRVSDGWNPECTIYRYKAVELTNENKMTHDEDCEGAFGYSSCRCKERELIDIIKAIIDSADGTCPPEIDGNVWERAKTIIEGHNGQ